MMTTGVVRDADGPLVRPCRGSSQPPRAKRSEALGGVGALRRDTFGEFRKRGFPSRDLLKTGRSSFCSCLHDAGRLPALSNPGC